MTVFQASDVESDYLESEDFDEELWQAACREADRRGDDVLPEDILREWDAVDTYDGYAENSSDLYDLFNQE